MWVEGEAPQACDTWDVLRAAGAAPYGRVTIPRLVNGARMFKDYWETFRGLRDKALHRLSLVGVVDDVTVDYGADTVTVDFSGYNNEFIDRSLIKLADRVQPGRHRHHLKVIDSSPSDFDERVRHHVSYAVDLVYAVVEPARLTALREMWLLTQDDPDDDRIRQTIAAYLGQGPMTTALAEIAVAPEIDVAWALRRLDASPPTTAFEWAAAAGRQLETYPDHPLLLIVRAVGEALLPTGDTVTFTELLRRAAEQLIRYGVALDARCDLFAWLRRALLNHQQGRREDWLELLWSSWHSLQGLEPILDQVSDEALADPEHHLYELPAVLAYRLRRLAGDDPVVDDPWEPHP